jgi:hypothetical protein
MHQRNGSAAMLHLHCECRIVVVRHVGFRMPKPAEQLVDERNETASQKECSEHVSPRVAVVINPLVAMARNAVRVG